MQRWMSRPRRGEAGIFFLSSPALPPESWRADHSDHITHFLRSHLCTCTVAPTSEHEGQHVEVMGSGVSHLLLSWGQGLKSSPLLQSQLASPGQVTSWCFLTLWMISPSLLPQLRVALLGHQSSVPSLLSRCLSSGLSFLFQALSPL